MLAIGLKMDEWLHIGDAKIKCKISGSNRVTVIVDAPQNTLVLRDKLKQRSNNERII